MLFEQLNGNFLDWSSLNLIGWIYTTLHFCLATKGCVYECVYAMSFRSLADIKISKALNILASKLVILEQNCLAFKDVFERSLFCSARLHLFDQKYSKKSEILFLCKTAVFYVNMC